MNNLTSKKCIPCSVDIPPMEGTKAKELIKELPHWELFEKDNTLRIKKDFKFRNFKEALNFVNKVGVIAEAEGHHPNINLHDWNKVEIENYTHKINGLHENDFILAAKIENILAHK